MVSHDSWRWPPTQTPTQTPTQQDKSHHQYLPTDCHQAIKRNSPKRVQLLKRSKARGGQMSINGHDNKEQRSCPARRTAPVNWVQPFHNLAEHQHQHWSCFLLGHHQYIQSRRRPPICVVGAKSTSWKSAWDSLLICVNQLSI